jgi:hypothetical protein
MRQIYPDLWLTEPEHLLLVPPIEIMASSVANGVRGAGFWVALKRMPKIASERSPESVLASARTSAARMLMVTLLGRFLRAG